MISKVTIVACVLVVLASMSAAHNYDVKRPWYVKMGRQTDAPPATSTSNTSNNNGNGGLGDRNPFLTPVESVSFKNCNSVPIEGPGTPCVGCVYRLTSNGFVKVMV